MPKITVIRLHRTRSTTRCVLRWKESCRCLFRSLPQTSIQQVWRKNVNPQRKGAWTLLRHVHDSFCLSFYFSSIFCCCCCLFSFFFHRNEGECHSIFKLWFWCDINSIVSHSINRFPKTVLLFFVSSIRINILMLISKSWNKFHWQLDILQCLDTSLHLAHLNTPINICYTTITDSKLYHLISNEKQL